MMTKCDLIVCVWHCKYFFPYSQREHAAFWLLLLLLLLWCHPLMSPLYEHWRGPVCERKTKAFAGFSTKVLMSAHPLPATIWVAHPAVVYCFFHTVEEEKKNRIWWIFFVNCRAHTPALLSHYYCISLVAQHILFGCSQARPELRCKRTVTLIFYGFLIISALLPYLSIMFDIIHLLAQVYVYRVIHGVIQMLGPTEMRHICCETWASPASFKLRKSPWWRMLLKMD